MTDYSYSSTSIAEYKPMDPWLVYASLARRVAAINTIIENGVLPDTKTTRLLKEETKAAMSILNKVECTVVVIPQADKPIN
jgi:hypothetical protein